jgi:putative hemolysin
MWIDPADENLSYDSRVDGIFFRSDAKTSRMDKYLFSYATASDPPIKRGLIRLVEKATGQPKLRRMYVHNQRFPRVGETFWQAAVRSLELDVRYDADALAAVPKTGPVVFVANHPYGVLDGIVMAWLVSKVRNDFVVLTHVVLTRAPEAAPFILPVDFSGTVEAERTNLASRAAARAQLAQGGAVVVFPAGAISTTPDALGLKPAVDARWQPFVSQLIQRSKATVIPIWFGGQNSRLFQVASHLSLTLRLSLIFHEVKTRIGTSLPAVIGAPIRFASIAAIRDRQALADDLRARVYSLARLAPAVSRPRRGVHKLLPPRRALSQSDRAA